MHVLTCNHCSCPVGEITKGTLKKNTVCYCESCNNLIQLLSKTKPKETYSNPFGDNNIFGDIFKNFKK